MRYLKIYKTRANEARIPLRLGDVTFDAHFVDGNIRDKEWATLKTTNPLAQFIIENSHLYGKTILLACDPIPLDGEKEPMKPEEVTNYQELREFLVNEYGIDRLKVSSPNAMKARVKELGIELPNMQF